MFDIVRWTTRRDDQFLVSKQTLEFQQRCPFNYVIYFLMIECKPLEMLPGDSQVTYTELRVTRISKFASAVSLSQLIVCLSNLL